MTPHLCTIWPAPLLSARRTHTHCPIMSLCPLCSEHTHARIQYRRQMKHCPSSARCTYKSPSAPPAYDLHSSVLPEVTYAFTSTAYHCKPCPDTRVHAAHRERARDGRLRGRAEVPEEGPGRPQPRDAHRGQGVCTHWFAQPQHLSGICRRPAGAVLVVFGEWLWRACAMRVSACSPMGIGDLHCQGARRSSVD